MNEQDRNRPLYMIGVAAALAGMHPQTLRSYEQKGLVTPQRTSGNTRMYSQADIERLELINELTNEGINLAGVIRILDLQGRLNERDQEIDDLHRRVRRLADLPESAAKWTDVRRLYLRGNGLKEVPPVVLKMTSLEELDLGENDLTALPEGLCALPKLHRLDVDGNPRLAALPRSITNMVQLTHLFAFRTALPTNEQDRVREAMPDTVRHFMAF